MVNYNNSVGTAASQTATVDPASAQFSAAKRISPPTPSQSLLADMCKNASATPSTALSVGDSKRSFEPAQSNYSASFALPAQAPGQVPAEFDSISHQNLSVTQEKKVAAVPDRPRPGNASNSKSNECSCDLIPYSRREDNTAVFPQAEALSTMMGGQPVNFGDALFTENTTVEHKSNSSEFIIKNEGIYELHYSLNYEVSVPCLLLFGFEGFPQSYFKQQIAQPSRGKFNVTVRLLLDTGTALRLVLVDDSTSQTVESALVSNAILEIKQLYQLKLNCPAFSAGSPEKNFRSEHSFLQTART